MSKSIKYIAVVKEDQQYLFRYFRGDEAALLQAVLQYAKNEHCNLNFADVIALIKRVRESILEEMELKEKV